MSFIRVIVSNLRLLLSRDIEQRLLADRRVFEEGIEKRIDAVEADFDERMTGFGIRLDRNLVETGQHAAILGGRIDENLAGIDGRLTSQTASVDLRLSEHLAGVGDQIAAQATEIGNQLSEHLAGVDSQLTGHAGEVDSRLESMERLLGERLNSSDSTIEERLNSSDSGIEERLNVIGQSLEARLTAFELRIEERMSTIDRQVEERMGVLDRRSDQRFEAIEIGNDKRFEVIEERVNGRWAEIEHGIDQRAGNYELAVDQRIDERLARVESQVSQSFAEHSRAVDVRLDDRQVGMDHRIDQRFNNLETRTDARLEAHELRTDRTLEQNRNDMIERTDLLLQVFDLRIDQQRREIAFQLDQSGQLDQSSKLAPVQQNTASDASGNGALEPVRSFRRLAAEHVPAPGSKRGGPDASLYQQIIDWKSSADEGLDRYTSDEEEIVEYLLSFIADPEAQSYVRQHMRRYLGTLHRIPPARRSGDRLLELGSLTPLAPAIRKFCGYQNIVGNNWWPGDDKVTEKLFEQTGGGERLAIPLHNFNVEIDPFPFPDGSFRVILCGELLEHLQRDPLHMLWECNRVLERDGYLILTTPNVAGCRSIEGVLTGCSPYLFSQYNLESSFDQHHREYAPHEVGIALAAAGFEVLKLETEDVWRRSNPAIMRLLGELGLSTDLRGDNIFALARKAGPPVERYPQDLYIG
ncbi:MAG: methyltransferase domain-containing protein [Blastocatellia bacterium]